MNNDYSFFCGLGKIDITPPLYSVMNGDFIPFYVKNVHDRIYAKTIIFKSDDACVVIVMIDTCSVTDSFTTALRIQLSKKTGIPFSAIIIAATHIHSGGALSDVFLTEADETYKDFVTAAVTDLVCDAKKNMQPCRISYGKVDVPEHVVSRRYIMKSGFEAFNPLHRYRERIVTNPFGDEQQIERRSGNADPEVCFLAIQTISGQWIGLLANYCLHYVGDFDAGTISGDYFGIFCERLKEKLGANDDFLGILTNGTSGNINIWDFLNPNRYPTAPFEKSRIIAEDIADKILKNIGDLEWDEKPSIKSINQTLLCQVRKPSQQELMHAIEIYKNTDYKAINSRSQEDLIKIFARETVLLSNEPDYCPVEITACRIGKGYIGILPGEFFADTGLWLKKQMAAKNYFTICMANGAIGYVPPDHELDAGGYETWRCRTSKLEKGSEEIIRQKLLLLLKHLH